jgi:2-phosphosulfolactate phosphatase
MRIKRLSLGKGARSAEGLAVIIDVFRAFSCEPLMFHYGARTIILEGDVGKCLAMRPGAVLVGERDGLPIPGFDLTNSPFLIIKKGRPFFHRRKIIHRTTSGVNGALAALERSDDVLLASFLTARATADYIRQEAPEIVSIVAMGNRAVSKAPEDEFCADYIESLLTGKSYDHLEAVREILRHESARKFLRGDKPYYPREDPLICLQRDLFDFTLRAERKGDLVTATAIRAAAPGNASRKRKP